MRSFTRIIGTAVFVLFMLLPASHALAETSNDVNKQMRSAQSLYFKGKVQEADDDLKKAEEMASGIMAGPDARHNARCNPRGGGLSR